MNGGGDMLAKDIMSKRVITVFSGTSVEELAGILTGNNISGAPVVDKEGHVIGIVTEKDIMYKNTEPKLPPVADLLGAHIYLGGIKKYNEQLKKILAKNVGELMTKEVVTVDEDTDIRQIAEIMLTNNINRVPVLDKSKKLRGIIGRTDIVRAISKTL
jgi:CBS domain-containing protein